GRLVATNPAKEREHAVGDDREHLAWLSVLETRPPEVGIRAALVVTAGGEDRRVNRDSQSVGAVLLGRLKLVEAADEAQIRDLLHDLERVRDPARPERVPDAVDARLQLPGDHRR